MSSCFFEKVILIVFGFKIPAFFIMVRASSARGVQIKRNNSSRIRSADKISNPFLCFLQTWTMSASIGNGETADQKRKYLKILKKSS